MSTVAIGDVLDLPVGERLRFVHEIWNSIIQSPDALPLTEAERCELDRRLDNYLRNPEGGRSWETVKASLLGEA
jgi:putative addiction module component (TIGR02574 family)